MKITYLIGVVLFACLASGLDIGVTQLPYHTVLNDEISGNGTYDVSYGRFLSGLLSVTLENMTTIQTEVLIPKGTSPGTYVSQVNVSNYSLEHEFRITDDVVFEVETDDQGVVGRPYNIFLFAPTGSSALVTISDFSESHVIDESEQVWFTPDKPGSQMVRIMFNYSGITKERVFNFTVYEQLVCTISAEPKTTVNTTVSYQATVTGGHGNIGYEWDFGDKLVKSSKASIAYQKPGRYETVLTVHDNIGNTAKCDQDIAVTEPGYTLIVGLMDYRTGRPLGDANVTIGDIIKKTNINGKASFYEITAGNYKISADKQGYDNITFKQAIANDTLIWINLTTDNTEKAVPEIELISPKDTTLNTKTVTFKFRVASQSKLSQCSLLVNRIGLMGYRVKDKVSKPKPGELTLKADLTNGKFRWNILCENTDGTGKANDWEFEIRGLEEPETSVKSEPEKTLDVTRFTELKAKIEKSQGEIEKGDEMVRLAYESLDFSDMYRLNLKEIDKLKTDYIQLSQLQISQKDVKLKESEIDSEINSIRAETPRAIRIISSDSTDNPEINIQAGVDEYVAWRDLRLSESQLKRYKKMVEDAQGALSVHSDILIAEIEYLNGKKSIKSIVSKHVEITEDVPGLVLLEVIPKTVAQDIKETKWSIPYELVNTDPVVAIYTAEHKAFNYYVSGDAGLEELAKSSSVVLLDPTNPQNKITGLAILDTGPVGSLFLIIVLLGSIAGGNYLIFFRKEEQRQKYINHVKNIRIFKSREQRLIELLDRVIDTIKDKGLGSALRDYPEVIEMYSAVKPKFREEIKPVISHLHYELEVFNLNNRINRVYSLVVGGQWYQTVNDYRQIQAELSDLPENFRHKISKKFDNIRMSMDIHMMKKNNSDITETVDDDLFGDSR